MNNSIQDVASIENSLAQLTDREVIVRFRNGRVISGWLRSTNGNYTLKLGVQHLSLRPELLREVRLLP